jgi:alpha-1,2-mannosyltransferase
MISGINKIINDLPASFYLKLFAAFIALFYVADLIMPTELISRDLRSYYFAAKTVIKHGNFYDLNYLNLLSKNAGTNAVFPYLYPPFLAQIIFPLSYLPPSHAHKIWSLALCIFVCLIAWFTIYLGSVYSIKNKIKPNTENDYMAFVFTIPLLIFLPFRYNISLGQVNIFLLGFILFSLILSWKKYYKLCAFFLSLSILIKVTPAILLFYFLIQKQYKIIAYTFIFSLLFFGLSIIIGGIEPWKWFFRFLPNMSYGTQIEGIEKLEHPVYLSLSSFFMRLIGKNQQVVSLLTYISAIIALLFIYLQSRKIKNHELLLLPLLILMVIASPVTYLHHLIFLMPGLFVLLFYILYNFKNSERKLYLGIILLLTLLICIDFPTYYRSQVGIKLFMFIARASFFSLNLFFLILLFIFSLYINSIVIRRQKQKNELIAA